MCLLCEGVNHEDITELRVCSGITHIPDTLVNLKELYCLYTEITHIPDTLVSLR